MTVTHYGQDGEKEQINITLPDQQEQEQTAWQLDTFQTIANFMQSLGWYYNKEANQFMGFPKAMKVNDAGFFAIYQYCMAIINKENALSHVEEEQIGKLGLLDMNGILGELIFNMKDYGITSYTVLGSILAQLRTLTVMHLNKSKKAALIRLMQEQRLVTLKGTVEQGGISMPGKGIVDRITRRKGGDEF